MTDYPILVEHYDAKHPADLAVCTRCDATMTVDPSEGDPYDRCLHHDGCGGDIVMKYDAADRCKGCGKLGYWDGAPNGYTLDGCCSRRCALQHEYAEALKARAS